MGGCGSLTDCGGNCVDTNTDVDNCGGCAQPCPSGLNLNGVASCKAATCVMQCFNGYADCNNMAVDGCETGIDSDTNNCGACGYFCDTQCNNGVCTWTTVVSGLKNPFEIALDATDVYFSDAGGIQTVPKGGGVPTPLSPVSAFVGAITLDATRVYWTDQGKGEVRSVPKAGGSFFVHDYGAVNQLSGVAVDANNIYWATGLGGAVYSAPLAGGAPVPLATGQQYTWAVAVDGTNVVWTQATPMGGVWRYPLGGPPMAQLVAGATVPNHMAVANGVAYYTDDQNLWSVPIAGGAVTVLAPNVPATVVDVVTDGINVYWLVEAAQAGQGIIRRVSINGGAQKIMANFLNTPGGLAVDGAHLYWTDFLDNDIKRISK